MVVLKTSDKTDVSIIWRKALKCRQHRLFMDISFPAENELTMKHLKLNEKISHHEGSSETTNNQFIHRLYLPDVLCAGYKN